MKTKILFLAVAAFAVIILAGCGNNSANNNMPAATNAPSNQEMPAPNAGGAPALTTNTSASTNQ